MSFDPRDTQGPDTVTCPGCGVLKNPDFSPKQCADCPYTGCDACVQPCHSGNHAGSYCEDHRYRVTLAPGCIVESCGECRDSLEIGQINCDSGHHMYRLISLGDGTDEGAEYRCEGCGSTDPEGDSARA